MYMFVYKEYIGYRVRKRFYHPLLKSKPAIMAQNTQTNIIPNHHKALGLRQSKIK